MQGSFGFQISPQRGTTRRKSGNVRPALMKIISRNVPATDSGQFGGAYAAANAVDGDYTSTWNGVNSPNGGSAQWLVLDLRGVSAGDKASVAAVWWSPATSSYWLDPASAALGPSTTSGRHNQPRTYKLQGHASSGAQPAVGDAGWTDLLSITDNAYNARTHTGLSLTGYNWFRWLISATNGYTGATEGPLAEIDLRSTPSGFTDAIFAYGDSITAEGFAQQKLGGGNWNGGPLMGQLEAAIGRCPVIMDGGRGGYTVTNGNTDRAFYLGGTGTGSVANPYPIVALNFGSNDANNAGSAYSGASDARAVTFYTDLLALVDYAIGLGKKVIVPKIPYQNINAWSAGNVAILNGKIDNLYAARPAVIKGPDLYTTFQAHPELLRDGLHPTYDSGVPAGMYNGLTGYEHYIKLWRDSLLANVY